MVGDEEEALAEADQSSLKAASVHERIHALVRQIPEGRVATYGQIARMEGGCTPRMVGYALAALPKETDVPWQRVINRLGKISARQSGFGSALQRALLEEEGVEFGPEATIDFGRYGWSGPSPKWLDEHGFRNGPEL